MKEVPLNLVDESGAPRFGAYSGVLNSTSLTGVSGLKKFYRRKKWTYQIVVTSEVIVLYAIVDLNYASSAFLTVLDLKTGEVADRSLLGLPLLSSVTISDAPASALVARLKGGGVLLETTGFRKGLGYKIRHPEIYLNAQLLTEFDRGLTVVAPVEGGVVNVTQKLLSSEVRGSLTFKGRSYDLGQGVAGLDYTHGYLARRSCWRWAMGMGRLPDGTVFGFNLVEGINESPVTSENAIWVGKKIYPLGRAVFEWNMDNLMHIWKVETTDRKIRLRFIPKFVHRENKNLGLIKSSFAQPIGLFEGEVELQDRSFSFKDAGGVTEFQDSTW